MAVNEPELEFLLNEAGTQLLNPPEEVSELLNSLTRVEHLLTRVEQSPSESMKDALTPSMNALVSNRLLRHQNVDVKVAVASCISEITRITAPEAPYEDDQMKDVFELIVSSFERLDDESSLSYPKRTSILETVAKVRSCVVMLDLECDELIAEMFHHFFRTIRSGHPEVVFSSMETIMTLVLEESEDISVDLLSSILDVLKTDNEEVMPVARELGEKVTEKCAAKLKPYLLPAIKSRGTSIGDYSTVVANVFQLGSEPIVPSDADAASKNVADTNDVANAQSEKAVEVALETLDDAPPSDEVGPVITGSPRTVASNGSVQKEIEDTSAGNDNPKEENHEAHDEEAEPTKTKVEISDSEELRKLRIKPEKSNKRKGKKHKSVKSSSEPSDPTPNEEKVGKEMPEPEEKDGKDADNAQSEAPMADSAEPDENVKESEGPVPSPKTSDEPVDVPSPSPSGSLADETRLKKAEQGNKNDEMVESVPSADGTISESKSHKRTGKVSVAVDKEDKKVSSAADKDDKKVSSVAYKEDKKVLSAAEKEAKKASSSADKEDKKVSSAADKEDKKVSSAADKEDKKVSSAADKEDKKVSSAADKEDKKVSSAAAKEEKVSSTVNKEDKKVSSAADKEGKKVSSSADKEDKKVSSSADKEDKKVPSAAVKKDKKVSSAAGKEDKKVSSAAEKEDSLPSSADASLKEDEKAIELVSKSAKQSGKKVEISGSQRDDKRKRGQGKGTAIKDLAKTPAKDEGKKSTGSAKSSAKSVKVDSDVEKASKSSSKRKRTNSKASKYGKELVGSRVQVWWPDDQEFYEGVVELYDPATGKHKVLYNDGDVENLKLANEKWKLIEDGTATNQGHSSDGESPDGSAERSKAKKAKTSPVQGAKRGKTETSTKKAGASSSKSKATPKSQTKQKVDGKEKDETLKSIGKSEDHKSGKTKESKSGNKISDNTPKSVGKSKDNNDLDAIKGSSKSKQETPKSALKSKGKSPKSGSSKETITPSAMEEDTEDVESSPEPTKAPENSQVKSPTASKSKKSAKKRKRGTKG